MKSLKISLLTAVIGLVGSGVASATAITTPGLTVTSGPATFNNFTCAFTSSGSAAGACASIDVSALPSPPTGIQFSTNMQVLGVSSADAAIGFNVASTSGISVVGLNFNSNFLGMDVNSVTEDVYTSLGGTLVGTATVYCGTITGCTTSTVSSIALSGSYSSLYVTKDINLSSFNGNSLGGVSIVQQTFASPEPMSVALIGGGLAMLGLTRIRKNRNKA